MKKLLCACVLVMLIAGSAFAAKADLDLTKFSSVMVYSGLFNVMANPYAYRGKTIKLKGYFDAYHDDLTGKDYFGVMVMDASACCATGLDFVLKGEHKYPEDYPETGAVITVMGKFDVYTEGEEIFCHLVDAEIM